MKIKSMRVQNFKSIEDLTWTPDNTTTVLIGPNGRGKTTFKEALYAGLTGDFPDNCIRNGCNQCSVKITLDDGTEFERIQDRIKPNKVLINGKTSQQKVLNEILTAKTGLSKDIFRIVASTDVIEHLKPSEFGTFILQYMPEKLDFATVQTYIKGMNKKQEQTLIDALPPMPETFSVKELTNAYNTFVESRKSAKKELSIRKSKVESFNIPEPKRDVSAIENELSDILRKDGAQKSAKTTIVLYNNAVTARKNGVAALAKLKEKIDSITATKPVVANLEKILSDKKSINKKMLDAQSMVRLIDDNIAVFKNTMESLDKPVCPISEKLICTTDKTAAKSDILELIESNKEGRKLQEDIIKQCNEEMLELDKRESEYRANELAYKEKVNLVARYDDQEKALPELPAKPAEITLTDYSFQIKELQAERNNALAWEQHLKDIKEQDYFQVEVDTYEFLCDALNPKGSVMCSIVDYYLSIFAAICNKTADVLRPGFEFKFISEDGVTYLVKTGPSRDWQRFDSLSSGEQLMTLFILVDMLNKLTNSRLMILDDLDKLDKTAFNDLVDIIQSPTVQDEYDHIILCAVNHQDIVDKLKTCSADWIYPV